MFAASCRKRQAGSLRSPECCALLIFKIAPADRRVPGGLPECRQREWYDRQTPDIFRDICRRLTRDRAAEPTPPDVELLTRDSRFFSNGSSEILSPLR